MFIQSAAPGRIIGWTKINTWISSKFSMFHWICLLFTFFISVDVDLLSCIAVIIVTLSYSTTTG